MGVCLAGVAGVEYWLAGCKRWMGGCEHMVRDFVEWGFVWRGWLGWSTGLLGARGGWVDVNTWCEILSNGVLSGGGGWGGVLACGVQEVDGWMGMGLEGVVGWSVVGAGEGGMG